ncbi:sulfatase-like hydrolase/transferase [Aquiflexum sp.]|uniref:sulfatase-like hydrolase/transferase n=1 Tax=Aquiflexum sp. TaxID=1872584 RepID=UPI0035931A7F
MNGSPLNLNNSKIKVNFIYVLFILILISCTKNAGQKKEASRPTPPNVIILLADDLGYGDLSSYGSATIETPYLDSLAAQGMRFTHFYSGSAVCSPSRACLLTGKFPLRFNIRRAFTDNDEHLPEGTVTLPKLLREAGYATAHIGKWHLGGLRPQDYEARQRHEPANPGPLQHGFDQFLTNIEGAPIRPALVKDRKLYREGGKYLVRNDERIPENPNHWTDIKVDEAVGLIENWHRANRPFFLNLWFDVPHTPYEPAPEPHLSKYEKMGVTGDQLYFRSMVSHLDANIGRLISKLKSIGIYDNTLIIFTSDNGPAFQGSPGPFKGGKTDLHEGGIRVPMFAVWPGRIPPNSYTFQVGHMADLLPTICEAVGFHHVPGDLDGISLLSHLKGGDVIERDILLWQMDLYTHFQNQGPKPTPYATSVALMGKWKLLADSLQPTELFDLEEDQRELYNKLGQEPEIEKALRDALQLYHTSPRKGWH